jgi:heme oxygenase
MTLPDRLRAAIAPAHVAVEQTGFAHGMAAGTLSRADYAAGLAQLGHLHAALEAALGGAADARISAVYDPARMTRSPLVDRDLAALGEVVVAEPADAVARLAEAFGRWAATAPHKLLGAVYVLEGSRMGSMVLARTLPKGLRVPPLPGHGLDYHLDGMATRPADWQRFRGTLAGLPLTPAEQDEVTAAAVETMDALVELYDGMPVHAAVPAMA